MGLYTIIGNKNKAVTTSNKGLEGKSTIAIPQEFTMTLHKNLRNAYRYYLLFNSVKQNNGKLFISEALKVTGRSPKQLQRIIKEGNKVFWIDRSNKGYLIILNSNKIIKAMKELLEGKETFMNRQDRTFAYIPKGSFECLKDFTDLIININAEVKNKGRYSKKQQAYVSKYKRNGVEGTNSQQNKAIKTIAKQTGYSVGKVCNSLKYHKGKHKHFITLILPEKKTPYCKDYKEVLEAKSTISYAEIYAEKEAKPLIRKTKNNNYYFVRRIANTYDTIIKTKTFRNKPKCVLPVKSGAYVETKAYSKCFLGIIEGLKNHYNLII